jgi:hypothetical protein
VYAVREIDARGARPEDERHALSIEAARAFVAKPETYDGAVCLEAARAIARDDPRLAYTHLANAVAFRARGKGKMYREAIVLAAELAEQHGWPDLRDVLEWTRAELGI